MKKHFLIIIFFLAITALTPAFCQAQYDPVCGMRVNTAESYDHRYEGKKYYFDSYDCREAFNRDPKAFLEKKCTLVNEATDIVCGKKVDLSESFDYKYSGKVYHFHTNDCKQAFKMNPEKFIKEQCPKK